MVYNLICLLITVIVKLLKYYIFICVYILTGVEGLEPANGGVKVRCLTTWLHPNNYKVQLYVDKVTLSTLNF